MNISRNHHGKILQCAMTRYLHINMISEGTMGKENLGDTVPANIGLFNYQDQSNNLF